MSHAAPRPSHWAVPRDDLKRLLGEGLSASEIARHHGGVAHTTVSRAIRSLEHQDLVAVVLGNRAQPKVPDVPTPTLEAPVDVMGVVMRVIGDVEAMRLWLNSEDAKTVLKTDTRINYALALMDKSLRWADTFVTTRSKLLELMTVDQWLQEMLAIIESDVPGARERILERVRQKLVGRELRPAVQVQVVRHGVQEEAEPEVDPEPA